jgi:hypothetical protein
LTEFSQGGRSHTAAVQGGRAVADRMPGAGGRLRPLTRSIFCVVFTFLSWSSRRRPTMSLAAEKELEHIGESAGCADHDHDLVHDLSKRLDALWRYDQFIANAEGKPDLQNMWCDMKRQEIANIKRVKQMISEEVRQHCF